jgi:hypothetical protein
MDFGGRLSTSGWRRVHFAADGRVCYVELHRLAGRPGRTLRGIVYNTVFDRKPDPAETTRLRATFCSQGYVALPRFLTDGGLALLRREARTLKEYARRRDFLMASMNNSARHMTTIGGHMIGKHSQVIPELYAAQELRAVLRAITDMELFDVPDAVERFVINYLHEPGDVHGAHFDDHPVAFVMFLEAPPKSGGGLLEMVPNAATLDEIGGEGTRCYGHSAGDCYVLRSDTSAHRVTPLLRKHRRVVLNMAFASAKSAATVSESASLLYA